MQVPSVDDVYVFWCKRTKVLIHFQLRRHFCRALPQPVAAFYSQ
jgi:hypothetical protein